MMRSPRRILIYRLGSLGDTVIALPCFHLIRRAFPSAHITVLTNRPVQGKAAPLESVLERSGLIDGVIDYPVGLRAASELTKLRAQIRAQKFDLAVHLTAARGFVNSVRDYLFFRWCGIATVIGVPFRREDLHVRRAANGLAESEAERLARRVRKLGDARLHDGSSWDLQLSEEEQQRADELLARAGIVSPFLAVSLGTKLPANDWGVDNWRQVLDALTASSPGLPIVAVGAEEEREALDSALAGWKGPAANLAGQTSPRLSAAVFRRALLFLGHDSGPMHLAAAVGTPCVPMFSARFPRGQWFPRGDTHTILVADKLCADCPGVDCRQVNGSCIRSIKVDEVVTAVTEKLKSCSALA